MTNFQHALRRPRGRRLAVVGIVATGGLLLAACGGNDDMKGMDHGSKDSSASAKATATPASGDFNDADVSFAQMMIDHHKGAITMAEDEQKSGRNAKAKKLAGDDIKNQSAEATTLRKILDRL
ncbi:DUF305 domain-containing protein [Streptomyces sp. NBRC 110028]|uniref:DUF305 domain-containing protein n=1 Tax=Streptomyces sp. NBRC 110028 TaxID=1621260 RepID=UPI0006E3D7C0|nr:DUF305 domain-containing protein [Streptomyces sp. NBRC 110028]